MDLPRLCSSRTPPAFTVESGSRWPRSLTGSVSLPIARSSRPRRVRVAAGGRVGVVWHGRRRCGRPERRSLPDGSPPRRRPLDGRCCTRPGCEQRSPDIFRSLWLYEPVVVPTGRIWPLPDGDNPMSEGAEARRRDRFESLDQAYGEIIDRSHRSTSCIPTHLGPMSMAAFRPIQTVRSRCAAGRPSKPRCFVRQRPAELGAPFRDRDACRRRGWPS